MKILVTFIMFRLLTLSALISGNTPIRPWFHFETWTTAHFSSLCPSQMSSKTEVLFLDAADTQFATTVFKENGPLKCFMQYYPLCLLDMQLKIFMLQNVN